jgi:uncharacterized membrane protein YGL010W
VTSLHTTHDPHSLGNWLYRYDSDHRHPINRSLQWICVPLILWSVLAMLWTIPVPESLLHPGAWSVFAIVLAFTWYWKHSHRLGAALLIAMALFAFSCHVLFQYVAASFLLALGIAAFALAFLGQCVGYALERRRPGFSSYLAYLLVGPAWLMDKLLGRLGIKENA